jgi:hypothetical protein
MSLTTTSLDPITGISISQQYIYAQTTGNEHNRSSRSRRVDNWRPQLDQFCARRSAAGAKVLDGNFNFLDPWGNHIEIVAYRDVQYSKSEGVLRSMGLALDKSEDAREQLRQKGAL